ncbi:MAG: hypothetical protein LBG80_12625 [Bacteroidales bacterium]|jgi:hypothetical protein|nr:hypothetical protein [Bacteroidales bacterium]
MRKIETLKFWGAVSLLIVAIGFSSYCFAVNNQKCVARRPASPTCRSAGDAACGGLPDASCVGSQCSFCDSTNTLPSYFCAVIEGSNCTVESLQSCGTSNYTQGICMRVTPDPFSPCARCGERVVIGPCSDSQSKIRVCSP